MKRFCLGSLCSHLNVLMPPPPCLGDAQKLLVVFTFFFKNSNNKPYNLALGNTNLG